MKEFIRRKTPKLFGAIKSSVYIIKRLNPFISNRYFYIFFGRFFDIKNRKILKIRPNLYIIGAEKAGTTSLHRYLDQHPEIFMSKPDKEPQYLLPMDKIRNYFKKGSLPIRNQNDVLKNQMLKGYMGEKIFGESTTSYTRGRNAAKLKLATTMSEMEPQPKIIYLARHPLDRIVSNYMHKKRGIGTDLTLDQEIFTRRSYLYTSLYGYQLRHYVRAMPPQNIFAIYFEDFVKDTDKVLKKVCQFLEVDQDYIFDTSKKHNTAANRKDRSKDPKFGEETYEKLMLKIKEDEPRVSKLWGRKPPWKYKKSDWT